MTRDPFRLLIGLSASVAIAAALGGWLAARSVAPETGLLAVVALLAVVSGGGLLARALRQRRLDDAAQRALAEREQLYRELVEGSLQGIIIVERHGKVLLANPAAARMFDYASPDELTALETIDVLLDPTDRRRVEQYRVERITGGTSPQRYEVRGHRRDGREMWCEVHQHRTQWGDLPVAQAFLIDITDRKAAELDLEHARDAAEAASRAKSEFLGNVSHELRTPMNAVIGLSHLALAASRDAGQSDYLRKIHGSAKALLGIIDDILDFSRIEAGGVELKPAEFGLDEVFEALRTMLGGAAEERDLALDIRVAPEVPARLIGDALRLGQVLRNLVSNSIKFSEQGPITLSVEAAGAPGALRFRVKDRGIGMSAEQQARLFQPFMQADGSSVRRYGGTGLGLILCKRLVEAMGGTIEVESAPGAGSIFSVTVVLEVPAGRSEPPASAPEPGLRLAGLRVLVVEDNPVNQAVTEGILAFEGALTTIAGNGRLAVEALRAASFDAVLMDLQMPVMDGYEATRIIRGELGLSRLPIIAVTAHALAEERQRCLEAGMNEHISKPVDPERLVETLQKQIGAKAEPTALPGIDMTDALTRLGGNITLLNRVYGDFCKQYAGAGAELAALIARGTLSEATALAHTIKGVAGNIGAKRIFLAARALEAELVGGGSGAEACAALNVALAELGGGQVAAPEIVTSGKPDPAQLDCTLSRLRELLRIRDLDAEECFATLKTIARDGPGRPMLGRLETAIDVLDFDAALDALDVFEAAWRAATVA